MKRNPWIPIIATTITILILTSIPKVPKPPRSIYFIDKIGHFVIYFFWGYGLAILWKSKNNHSNLFISSILLSILFFPAFDELHQYFIPGRHPSFFDWISDFLGATTGFFLFVKVKNRLIRKSNQER